MLIPSAYRVRSRQTCSPSHFENGCNGGRQRSADRSHNSRTGTPKRRRNIDGFLTRLNNTTGSLSYHGCIMERSWKRRTTKSSDVGRQLTVEVTSSRCSPVSFRADGYDPAAQHGCAEITRRQRQSWLTAALQQRHSPPVRQHGRPCHQYHYPGKSRSGRPGGTTYRPGDGCHRWGNGSGGPKERNR